MDESTREPGRCGSPHDASVVLGMIGALVVPAALTLLRGGAQPPPLER